MPFLGLAAGNFNTSMLNNMFNGNKLMQYLTIVSCCLLLFCSVSCEKAPEEVAIKAVSLSQATAEMIIGETAQLQVSIVPSNATDKTVIWASSKQSVATVSTTGLVYALSEGTSSITATAGGITATCEVTVIKGFVDVSSILLNTTSLYLVEGEQETLAATVLPEDASNQNVEWSSSVPSVASVKDGIVSAHKEGTATITAKAGNHSAECVVVVKPKVIAVSEIILNKNKLVLMEGEEETLVATVKPDNATDKTVEWTSSDESVARVSSSGKVSAIAGGAAIITAKSGEKQAVCLVEVQKRIPVSSVTLNKESLILEKGQSETLVASVFPVDATDKTVTWSSSNPAIATVTNGIVNAVVGGNATITASAGGQSATCEVTVIVSVTNLVLSETSLTLVEGQTSTLTVKIEPYDATDKTVTWVSDNPEIASVENGKVTALSGGQTTISASSGGHSASCVISVLSEIDLDLPHAVTVQLNSSYGIALYNGNRFYTKKVTIRNNSIVDVYVNKVESPNCYYYSYDEYYSSMDISVPRIVSINSAVGTIKAGKSFELNLYCTQYPPSSSVIIWFKYNGHDYKITN